MTTANAYCHDCETGWDTRKEGPCCWNCGKNAYSPTTEYGRWGKNRNK